MLPLELEDMAETFMHEHNLVSAVRVRPNHLINHNPETRESRRIRGVAIHESERRQRAFVRRMNRIWAGGE